MWSPVPSLQPAILNERNKVKNLLIPLFTTLTIALATLLACSSPSASNPSNDASSTPADPVAQGKVVFLKNCAGCHGINGQGQPNWHLRKLDGTLPAPPLNGDGHTWHHADGLLYRIVSDGGAELAIPGYKSGMPALGEKLSHQEIVAVLTYVKSLWTGKMSRGLSITESQAFASQNDPFPEQ